MKETGADRKCGKSFAWMVAAYERGGVRGEAALWHSMACEQAAGAVDPRWRIRLLSCTVLFLSPAAALGRVRQAHELAKAQDLRVEMALSQANLGLLWLKLGDFDAAQRALRASVEELSGGPRAVALNNLALAVGRSNRRQAMRLLASAMGWAERPHSSVILANQAAFEAEEEPHRLPDFAALAGWVAEDCAPPFVERVRFNQARALFEGGRPGAALALAERAGVAENGDGDGALVAGQWACLCREIHRAAGRLCPADTTARAERLDRSPVPQAWLYRLRWALCPIPLYGPPPPVETAEAGSSPIQRPGKEKGFA